MAYTLHVDRGVPRIVAAAAADPPNDPDVVALPGDTVTAEQVQRHNAQAAAMEQAIVPLRASELIMLRDLAVAMRSLPWYVGPARETCARTHHARGPHTADIAPTWFRTQCDVSRVSSVSRSKTRVRPLFLFFIFSKK